MALENKTGSPVEGDDFFGREKELEAAWKHILKGNSLILSAPRRVGKSSFAKKLLTFAKKEDWNTVEIDLEEINSEPGFVALFVEKLKEQDWWSKSKSSLTEGLTSILEQIKPSIEFGEVSVAMEWKAKKEDAYEKLKKLLDHDKDTLIMVDELGIFLNYLLEGENKIGTENVAYFLNWMRSFRQKSGTKIRWVICSSVGISNFASRHNMSHTINDIMPFPIGPYDDKQALGLLQNLEKAEGVSFPPGIQGYILSKIEWHLPYFIQILFFNINQLISIHGGAISSETVNEAYKNLINEKHLNTWDERLSEYKEMEKLARAILMLLAKNKQGEKRETLLNIISAKEMETDDLHTTVGRVLAMLINDGYLIDNENGKYSFRSPLLRDFWHNRFVK